MASGNGKLYFDKVEYNPVPGDRKSGMPAATEMPAPERTTMFLIVPLLIACAMSCLVVCSIFVCSNCLAVFDWLVSKFQFRLVSLN